MAQIYSHTAALLSNAQLLNQSMIQRKKDQDVGDRTPQCCGYYGPCGYNPSSFDGRCESPKDPSTVPIAIAAALGAFIAIYPLSQNWSEISQMKTAKNRLVIDKDLVDTELQTADPSIKDAVQAVFSRQMNLLGVLQKNAMYGLFWKGLLITSLSGLAYSAGLTALSSAITPVALAGLGISALAMVWRSGARSTANQTINMEAAQLDSNITGATKLIINATRETA